ncbi:hypothetical protein AAVH_26096 [Aphelenchoides avenae]|nr:hypothetical protein AAVH_26096 [Aphelenchus avenae]
MSSEGDLKRILEQLSGLTGGTSAKRARKSSDEEPKNLWRLTVPRWTDVLHKCDECNKLNVARKDERVVSKDGVTAVTTFLKDCCRDSNLKMSDVYFKNFKWQKKEDED